MNRAPDKLSSLRDFRAYGKLEGINALLLPAVAAFYGWPEDLISAIALVLANVGMVAGLIIGKLYWQAVAASIDRSPAPMKVALRIASAAQVPLLVVIAAATVGATSLVAAHGWSLANCVPAIVTLLAALEYLNYYHFQLQHFDNLGDWRRLLAGQGFRRAHMARALARWRRANTGRK